MTRSALASAKANANGPAVNRPGVATASAGDQALTPTASRVFRSAEESPWFGPGGLGSRSRLKRSSSPPAAVSRSERDTCAAGRMATKNRPPAWGRAVSSSWYHPTSPSGLDGLCLHGASAIGAMQWLANGSRLIPCGIPSPSTDARRRVRGEARGSYRSGDPDPAFQQPRFSASLAPVTCPRHSRCADGINLRVPCQAPLPMWACDGYTRGMWIAEMCINNLRFERSAWSEPRECRICSSHFNCVASRSGIGSAFLPCASTATSMGSRTTGR